MGVMGSACNSIHSYHIHVYYFMYISDSAGVDPPSVMPQTLFPTPEASALMSNSSASLLAAAASSASNIQAEAARQFLHQLSASHALNPPSQVDLRESSINKADLGVWAVETIPHGTRFGPFMGKWTMEPSNPKFAWEVSDCLFLNRLYTIGCL